MSSSGWQVRKVLIVFTVVVFLVLGAVHSQAQPASVNPPRGDAMTGYTDIDHDNPFNPYGGNYCSYSARSLAIYNRHSSSSSYLGYSEPLFKWSAPPDVDIVKVSVKKKDEQHVFVLMSDGSIYGITVGYGAIDGPTHLGDADPLHGGETFADIIGDALYALSNQAIFISRDSARTWQIDTAGIGGGGYYQIAMDTNQFVYAAHVNGLYKQHPDSNIWHKVTTLPNPNALASTVFADRKNRIYARSSGKMYRSTNNGSTWNLDTAGTALKNIKEFCDDRYGNVYANDGNALWRSAAGTQPWVRIDQPIQSLVHDPSAFMYSQLFNHISADSLLYAATALGMFFSTDQGTTWNFDSSSVPAKFIYGFLKTTTGRFLTSTNLGVYSKNPGDSVWKKTFPLNGFFSGSPIFTDGSGSAYTIGKRINSSDVQSMFSNWKSTDGGQTWNADTAGLGAIRKGQAQIYFADETGRQHLGSYDSPATLYSKTSGLSWTSDTAGFGGSSMYPFGIFSDKKGFIYAAVQNKSTYKSTFLKRSVSGGSWIPDSSGMNNAAVYSLAGDKNGALVAGTYTGLYQRKAGTWSQIQHPFGLDGYNTFVVSIDSSGVLLAGFSVFVGYNVVWRGVYATKDYGAHWTYIGLDGISIRGLVSYGDTTYAYTYADGIYLLRSTITGVNKSNEQIARAYSLEQNYPNPFNPTTTITYQLPVTSFHSLKVYDMLGREVATLVNSVKPAGRYSVTFDASKLSSGVYFYRLDADSYHQIRKLILLK